MQPFGRSRLSDEVDNCLKTGQWFSPPVLGDVTEKPMFNRIRSPGDASVCGFHVNVSK
jgi:hypothetical protein